MASDCKSRDDDSLAGKNLVGGALILKLINTSSKPSKIRKRGIGKTMQVANSKATRSALASDLKQKYGKNAARVRIGDRVKLIKGEYSGIEGKVQKVYPSEGRVTVEGITREKIAGGTTPVKISATNLVITDLNLEDKWRRRIIEGST